MGERPKLANEKCISSSISISVHVNVRRSGSPGLYA